MEARIEAVEEELRLEKQKNASLERQSRQSAILGPAVSCQGLATDCQRGGDGKKTKTTPSGRSGDGKAKTSSGPGDDLKTGLGLKERRSQGGLEVNRYECRIEDV